MDHGEHILFVWSLRRSVSLYRITILHLPDNYNSRTGLQSSVGGARMRWRADMYVQHNDYFSYKSGGSSTKSFRPEAKKEGGWVKTILEKSPFIEKIVQAFLGVSDPDMCIISTIMAIKSVYFLTIFSSRVRVE